MPDTDRYVDEQGGGLQSLRVSQFGHPGQQREPKVLACAWRWPLTDTMSLWHCHRINGWRALELPIVPTATNRVPHRSQDPQGGADDQQDDPNLPQNRGSWRGSR